MSGWHLQTGGWWWAGLVVATFIVLLSIVHIRRETSRRRALLLEGLRLSLVFLALITLLFPERIQQQPREQKPQVVILADRSASMTTEDMPDGSREDWVRDQLDRTFWKPLQERYETAVEWLPDDPAAQGTNLHAPLARTLREYQHLQALILLSDGDWNEGQSPLSSATSYAIRQVPIYPLAIGRGRHLPDLILADVQAPSFCLLNEQVSIPFRVVNHLPREVRTELVIRHQGRQLTSKPLTLPPGGTVQDVILWTARTLGEFNLELAIPVEPEEELTDNNRHQIRIAVRQERLKVLVIETRPRWEYRYLRNALSRDPGINLDCLLLHPGMERGEGEDYIASIPATRDLMSHYDVIFLGDVEVGPQGLSEEQLALIAGVVEYLGSGLVLLPGPLGHQLGYQDSPLADLLPIIYDESQPGGFGQAQPAHLQLTSQGADHLLTMLANGGAANRRLWRDLPGFYWSAPVLRARPGTEVLAVHSGSSNDWGRLPLLATRHHGQGNVLFMGTDSAWRWRKGVEDVYHYRFWGQVVRWMAHPRHLAQREGIRLVFSPESPRQGDTVLLHAMVADRDGFPLGQGPVRVTITYPDATTAQQELRPMEGGWGVYEGTFTPQQPGLHHVRVVAPGPDRSLTTEISVSGYDREQIGAPANHDLLRELGRTTGGELIPHERLDQLVQTINLLPQEQPRLIRYALWLQWWWGGLLVLLLATFWILRKLYGYT